MIKKIKYIVITLITFLPFISINAATKVKCGNITDIPAKIPELTSFVVTLVQIAVPVVLIITGMLDLLKGITAQKEDEIKKGQQMFIKRLILGALIFFVIVIVKFAISLVADSSTSNIVECIDCFVDNDCKRQGLSGILDEAEDLKDGIIDGLNSVKDNIEQTVEK